ncbi:ferredoxin [Streptomyces fuscichromogenes]|uniref:ferredoxin n=1 Tax=Streptomyces fuscichromogenes TaxID=1324013 RepID=UPI0037F58508
MTWTSSQQDLYRFLEDRFACALACTECARTCALRAGVFDPDGADDAERLRRTGIMCAEVCEATCRALTEEAGLDAAGLRVQLQWCRTVCLDSARAFDGRPGAEPNATACRACATACTDFMAALD